MLTQHTQEFVLSVATTADGAWILSASKDQSVQFWDAHTGQAQLRLKGHTASIVAVAVSPVGGYFATASGDKRARIWSYSPHKEETLKRGL